MSCSRKRFVWTRAAEDQLIHMIEVDELTYVEVARRLSTQLNHPLSRLAISGKVHKLKAAGRMMDVNRRTKLSGAAKLGLKLGMTRKRASRAKRSVPPPRREGPVMSRDSGPVSLAVPTVAAPVRGADGQPGVTLLAILDGQCRWPVSGETDEEMRFCGHTTAIATGPRGQVGVVGSFCPAHCRASMAQRECGGTV